MTDEYIQLTGKEDGPTSVVLVGVHGDEVCGVRALDLLLPTLEIEKGTVWFGYGNPRAIKENVRQVQENLNRMFKSDCDLSMREKTSYEYTRAQEIKKYLDQADALLDVHASYTPQSRPFVICEQNAYELASALPADLVVSGFDDVQPGGTDYYMNQQGKIGICLECGYLGDPLSTQRAIEGIFAFLRKRGHCPGTAGIVMQTYMCMKEMYLAQTSLFVLAQQFNDFDEVRTGDIIGHDGTDAIQAKTTGRILFARNGNMIGDEVFLFGEDVKRPSA